MSDRTQRVKGKANEAAGKAKAAAGYHSGSGKTEAKGVGKQVKGKAQQAAGKARSTAKKKTWGSRVPIEEAVTSTAARRLAGERASRPQAFLAASVAAVTAGVVVYRLLRTQSRAESAQ
jgi:uncharacterized protein YjbJ (UPF0337 family)